MPAPEFPGIYIAKGEQSIFFFVMGLERHVYAELLGPATEPIYHRNKEAYCNL